MPVVVRLDKNSAEFRDSACTGPGRNGWTAGTTACLKTRKSLSKSTNMCGPYHYDMTFWSFLSASNKSFLNINREHKYIYIQQIYTENFLWNLLPCKLQTFKWLMLFDSSWFNVTTCRQTWRPKGLGTKQLHNFHWLSRWELMSTTGHPHFLHMWSLSSGMKN